jgi:hypothetical protein
VPIDVDSVGIWEALITLATSFSIEPQSPGLGACRSRIRAMPDRRGGPTARPAARSRRSSSRKEVRKCRTAARSASSISGRAGAGGIAEEDGRVRMSPSCLGSGGEDVRTDATRPALHDRAGTAAQGRTSLGGAVAGSVDRCRVVQRAWQQPGATCWVAPRSGHRWRPGWTLRPGFEQVKGTGEVRRPGSRAVQGIAERPKSVNVNGARCASLPLHRAHWPTQWHFESDGRVGPGPVRPGASRRWRSVSPAD